MLQSTVPRLGLADFLGTLPGGFYTLLVLYSVTHAAGVDLIGSGSWRNGYPLHVTTVVFMASFLIGSLYRAVPVSWIARDKAFPYPDRIEDCLATLSESSSAVGPIPSVRFTANNEPIKDQHAVMIFDFWKAVIGQRSPNAFNHIKSLEAKARMFVGLICAAVVGLAIWVAFLPLSYIRQPEAAALNTGSWGWWWPLVCSLLLGTLCWFALRRARREEVTEVVWSYVAVLQNSTAQASKYVAAD